MARIEGWNLESNNIRTPVTGVVEQRHFFVDNPLTQGPGPIPYIPQSIYPTCL